MKIFNWVGGSFFRTLGRFLFYILIGSLFALLFRDNVFADEYNYSYISNYSVPQDSQIIKTDPSYINYNLGVGSMGDIVVTQGSTTSQPYNIWNRAYQYTTDSVSISKGSEIWVQTYVGLRNVGNLYSYQLLLCTNKSIPSYHSKMEIGLTSWSSYYFPQHSYKTQTWGATDNNVSWYTSSSGISNCYSFSGYGAYKSNTTTISLHLVGSSSLSNVTFYIMGYQITDLGYYKENMLNDIQSIINNNMSGVATKSDIASVNSKIEQTNQSIDKVNDTLNDDNVDDTKVSGSLGEMQSSYTNPTTTGPLSGFLLMPLNWIQSFLAPSGACQSIQLPLPFVNRTLTLPCMTDFWNSLGLVSTLIEMVWIAVVGTRIFNGLFHIVVEIKNPEPDKDMTLIKSWEL